MNNNNTNSVSHHNNGSINGGLSASSISSPVSPTSPQFSRELIIMTPVAQAEDSTAHIIRVERFNYDPNNQNDLPSDILHVAGGQHSGIVVRKQITHAEALSTAEETDVTMDFNVYLVDAASGSHKQENRQLRLWYVKGIPTREMHSVAFEFLKNLLTDCPKDYIGFVKKIMKLMQRGFGPIRKVEIEMSLVDEPTVVPELETTMEIRDVDVLDILERAYPNSVAPHDIGSNLRISVDQVELHISKLVEDGKVTRLDTGNLVIVDTVEKSIVKHMPKVSHSEQPTIALITSLYVEKLAVDAMIENKETFIRYKTDGESNIYTLGNIGPHKVVATKLSSIGQHSIAAGSITTRLLGGYPQIEHVLVVGVGGGVPHFTDKDTHVRLGDVVMAASASMVPALQDITSTTDNATYIFCDSIKRDRDTQAVLGYAVKTWTPKSAALVEVAHQLVTEQHQHENESEPWADIFTDAIGRLTDSSSASSTGTNFSRPSADTDVLSVPLGGGNVATVSHPDRRCRPRLHLGPVGAGGHVSLKHSECRQDFAQKYHLKAYDAEFDSVVESICGNRVDSWTMIRGIADYGDGAKNKQWQAYAALQAASAARLIVERLPAPVATDE